MIVIVLTACPVGLRGDLTRWLLEISPGVFVGHVSARVREKLWERVHELVKDGRAIMVYSARNEQHLEFKIHNCDWVPVDCDGLTLIKRLSENTPRKLSVEEITETFVGKPKRGWSKASKYRKARKYSK